MIFTRKGQSEWVTKWPRWASSAISAEVIFLGFGILLGWLFNVSWMQALLPGALKMAPLTALAFVLLGVALGISVWRERVGDWHKLGDVCAGVVIVVAVLRLVYYLMGWAPVYWERLWFFPSSPPVVAPLMSAATASNFFLLSLALLLARHRRGFVLFQSVTLFALLIAWLGFSGHFYGGDHPAFYGRMAQVTAVEFLLLSAGILCAWPDRGLVALLTSEGAGGDFGSTIVDSFARRAADHGMGDAGRTGIGLVRR